MLSLTDKLVKPLKQYRKLLTVLEENAKYGRYVFIFTGMEDETAIKDAVLLQEYKALKDRCFAVKLQDERDEKFRLEWCAAMKRIIAENNIDVDVRELGQETGYSIRAGLSALQLELDKRLAGRFSEKDEETDEITLFSIYKKIIENAGKRGISAKEIAAELTKSGEIHKIKSANANKSITSALSRYLDYYGKKCGIKKANRRYYYVFAK